ncbi:MAG: FecR domain-containing protein [Pseudomonadota bacterium]
MADNEDNEDIKRRRAQEAASIFRRLNENPADEQALQDRDAFLARGEAEQKIYAQMTRALSAAKMGMAPKPKAPKSPLVLVFFIVLGAALYFGYEPAFIALQADARTELEAQSFDLISGDMVILDASTALADETDGTIRQVRLLKGAAFFDVNSEPRPFAVVVDGLTVEVLGTAFEVSKFNESISVSVAEGRVTVRIGVETWTVQSGQRLTLDDNRQVFTEESPENNIANWRDGFLVTDGMTFGEVAEVIDRRLQGPILILDDDLANTRVSGRIDLSRPIITLRALAATKNGTVRSIWGLGTIVTGD